MFFKKFNISFILTICSLQVFLFSGCASNNTKLSTGVGPSLASSYSNQKGINSAPSLPKLDVIIPVFDPGLPQDPDDYEDENIWPEIRRAEANRFAYKLKEKLDETTSAIDGTTPAIYKSPAKQVDPSMIMGLVGSMGGGKKEEEKKEQPNWKANVKVSE